MKGHRTEFPHFTNSETRKARVWGAGIHSKHERRLQLFQLSSPSQETSTTWEPSQESVCYSEYTWQSTAPWHGVASGRSTRAPLPVGGAAIPPGSPRMPPASLCFPRSPVFHPKKLKYMSRKYSDVERKPCFRALLTPRSPRSPTVVPKTHTVQCSKELWCAVESESPRFLPKGVLSAKNKCWEKCGNVCAGGLLENIIFAPWFLCSSRDISDVGVCTCAKNVRTKCFKELWNPFQKSHAVVFKMRSSFRYYFKLFGGNSLLISLLCSCFHLYFSRRFCS